MLNYLPTSLSVLTDTCCAGLYSCAPPSKTLYHHETRKFPRLGGKEMWGRNDGSGTLNEIGSGFLGLFEGKSKHRSLLFLPRK